VEKQEEKRPAGGGRPAHPTGSARPCFKRKTTQTCAGRRNNNAKMHQHTNLTHEKRGHVEEESEEEERIKRRGLSRRQDATSHGKTEF